MNEKLQQAITAARNGQAVEAQLLLTQVLKEDPNETQAWFLLSTLVDSEQKKTAYLGKVLALEPDHQMAQKMLARLQAPDLSEGAAEIEPVEVEAEVEPVEPEAAGGLETEEMTLPEMAPVSANTADFMAQEKGGTLPEWLMEEEGIEPEAVAAEEAAAVAETVDDHVPDWLQEEVPESWVEETVDVEEPVIAELAKTDADTSAASKSKPSKATAVPATDVQKQQKFLTGILYALIAVAVAIFFLMAFFAWQSFF